MIKFGTDGWRSLMSDSFNVENVKKVAQAIADYLQSPEVRGERRGKAEVFIGYDTRKNSDVFARACAETLLANNIEALLPSRAIPTPITAYTIKEKGLAGAIMITASHNPAEYNGIKFIPYYAGPATEEITAAIERNLNVAEARSGSLQASIDGDQKVAAIKPPVKKDVAETFRFPCGGLKTSATVSATHQEEINPVPSYQQHLANELIDVELLKRAKLKVLANPMFGAAHGIFAGILDAFGCRVEEIDGQADPEFGGLTPEPIPKNLVSTTNKLQNDSYDLVLALDGDADRFGVFDAEAQFIQANHVLALIADYLVTVRKLSGALVRSVATTHFLDLIAQKNDLEAIETPVGFKYIGEIMRNKPVVLGGEESAGLSILNHIPEKDGILANLLLAEITAYYKKPLSKILEDLFEKYNRRFITKRLDLELTDEQKSSLIEKLKHQPPNEIAGIKVNQSIDIDGVKFILEEGSWLLARPSGTEPIVRVYLEADSNQKLEALEEYVESQFRTPST